MSHHMKDSFHINGEHPAVIPYLLDHYLPTPRHVLLRRHVPASKYEPLVDEVVLLEANPQYAHIRFTNGRESTVSVSDLAPARNSLQSGDVVDDNIQKDLNDSTSTKENPQEKEVDSNDSQTIVTPEIVPCRERINK